MVVVHLIVDVRDAMGANTVNTMAEAVAPMIETISGGVVRLRILSNFADLRIARAMVTVAPETLQTDEYTGDRIARGIVEACALAIVDPYRAATHNKGIMNGIDPIVVATGNDWRAIEAGAHVWASRSGRYTSLSTWEIDAKGQPGRHARDADGSWPCWRSDQDPSGSARGTQDPRRRERPRAGRSRGRGWSFAEHGRALRALATEGIQRGHMALHARNIAIVAGATGDEIEKVAASLAADHDVRVDRARDVLEAAFGPRRSEAMQQSPSVRINRIPALRDSCSGWSIASATMPADISRIDFLGG